MGKHVARLTIAFLIQFALSAYGENGGRGGGDSLFCHTDVSVSPFDGYYSLDYIATFQQTNNNSDVVQVDSWKTSADRIMHNLNRLKAYNLLYSFSRFYQNINNINDYTTGILWQEAGYGLVDINDEALIHKIPQNCLDGNRFIQTVIWQDYNNLIIFNFDYNIVKKLPPLQLSFLYIHEWLWSHFNKPDAIRFINRLLHSDRLDIISEYDFSLWVSAFGPVYFAKIQGGVFVADDGEEVHYSPHKADDPFRGTNTFLFKFKAQAEYTDIFSCNFGNDGLEVCRSNDQRATVKVINFSTIAVKLDNQQERVLRYQHNFR